MPEVSVAGTTSAPAGEFGAALPFAAAAADDDAGDDDAAGDAAPPAVNAVSARCFRAEGGVS